MEEIFKRHPALLRDRSRVVSDFLPTKTSTVILPYRTRRKTRAAPLDCFYAVLPAGDLPHGTALRDTYVS